MSKSHSLNIALTEEMKQYIASQSGEGTLYSTPSEYVRDLIRHDRAGKEAESLRASIIEGYQDAIHGRTTKFSGDLRKDLRAFRDKR